MNDNTDPKSAAQQAQKQQQRTTQQPERAPIRVEKLLISHANPHGVKVPEGPDGKSDRLVHSVFAGISGEVRTEIEYRPWLRAFRVVKSKRVTRTGLKGGAEVVAWNPMGQPFFIPEAWCVWVPVEE